MRRWLRVALYVVGALAVLVAVLAVLGTPPVEKIRSGRIVEDSDAYVHQVRFLGFLDVYVEAFHFRGSDVSVAIVLTLVGGGCLVIAAFLWALAGPRHRRLVAFYGLAAVGALCLAADEALSIHEAIGHTTSEEIGGIPGFERNDDAVFVLYAIPAGVFLWVFRDLLLESRRALKVFAIAIAAFLATAVLDSVGSGPESAVELLTAVLLLVAFGELAAHHAAAEIRGVGVEPQPLVPRSR